MTNSRFAIRPSTGSGPRAESRGSSRFLLLAVCLSLAGCGAGGFRAVKTFQDFDRRVLSSDKPVLVEFHKYGCPACMMLGPTLEGLAREYGRRAGFVKVERSEGAELRRFYNIGAYPTVILFVRGQQRQRWVNEHDPQVYRLALNSALAESPRRRW